MYIANGSLLWHLKKERYHIVVAPVVGQNEWVTRRSDYHITEPGNSQTLKPTEFQILAAPKHQFIGAIANIKHGLIFRGYSSQSEAQQKTPNDLRLKPGKTYMVCQHVPISIHNFRLVYPKYYIVQDEQDRVSAGPEMTTAPSGDFED